MTFHKPEALTYTELANEYKRFRSAIGYPEFEGVHQCFYKKHEDGEAFNKYRFWEDIVLLAAEAFDSKSEN